MLYVQHDDQGRLVRVETTAFAGHTGQRPANASEVLAWYANQAVEASMLQLRQSDQEMIRVLEDLIGVLIAKGVIRITDLPPAAQSKLFSRNQAREALGGLSGLIGEEETSTGLI